jgi:multidrug transporter EmrE-like cation transporter
MAYQKLQPTQAYNVILSNTVNVISPSRAPKAAGITESPDLTNGLTCLTVASILTTGTIDGGPTSLRLIDSTANFTKAPAVKVGDTVINTVDTTLAVVSSVDSATELTLSVDIMDTASEGYTIYTGNGFRGSVNVGDLVLNESANTLTACTVVTQCQLTFATDAIGTVGTPFKAYGSVAEINTDTEPFVVYVGGGAATADIKVTTAAGNEIVFGDFPKGDFLPVQCVRVWSTGTSSSNIVALW